MNPLVCTDTGWNMPDILPTGPADATDFNTLYNVPCNTSDPAQRFDITGGALKSTLTGQCLDQAASKQEYFANFAPCIPGKQSQAARLSTSTQHFEIGGHSCLDCYESAGNN